MKLSTSSILQLNEHPLADVERTKRKVMRYHWQEDVLCLHLLPCSSKIRGQTTYHKKDANEIGHFGEAHTLFEVK